MAPPARNPPTLVDDADTAYLDDVGAILPNDVNTTIIKLNTISNTIGTLWSPINDVQGVRPAFAPPGVLLSPLRDQHGPASLAAGGILPCGDGENIHISEELPLVSEWGAPSSEAHGCIDIVPEIAWRSKES